MTDDRESLRAQLEEIDSGDWEAQVPVYESILRLREGDLLAARGLALALVKVQDFDRAEEVVEEALLVHGEDRILLNRMRDIESARRRAVREAAASRGNSTSQIARLARTWIKAVHYDNDGWTEEPGTEMWISDPGQRDENGVRLLTAANEPRGRPSWRLGEQSGIYFGGTHRVPMLVEIISTPEFDPAFVQAAEWANPDDGERWPWVTWVRVLKSVKVEAAPTLDELGIASSSMQQRARLLTDPEVHARLVQALEAAS